MTNVTSDMTSDALAYATVSPSSYEPYHVRPPKRSNAVPPEQREFIAWDGEGENLRGSGRPQSYILFGCSTGDYIFRESHIHTFELLDFIVGVGRQHPTAFHVGFAFNYDVNMILQSLSRGALEIVHKKGRITLHRKGHGKYHIQYLPSKWFSVTKYDADYDRKKKPHAKVTVRIYDLFGFFAKSFVKAYEELIGPVPEIVVKGKDQRGKFPTLEYIRQYWLTEIQLLRELAVELRRRLYGAGLRITSWHGPGALASYAMRQHHTSRAMAVCPQPVREAAKYAYAGGRFEIFKLGRIQGPIYSVDINSAYPFGISRLPSLATGQWRYVEHPRSYARFGVYRVRLLPRPGGSFLERAPGPLFHRDKMGNISFPWITDGWYWSPEVINLTKLDSSLYEVMEGWEYIGGGSEKPFGWVRDTYNTRREWKEQGIAAQLALKLLLNSMYGKMAQRVGWNEEKRLPPQWHQLEWAGWVTSHCRAMLWDVMCRIPWQHLIAVETDGLYTTMNPAELGITNSTELGGWEVTEYDEIVYVQSGMAWLRKGAEWSCKRRGLDAKSFPLDECLDYVRSLESGGKWESYRGEVTRFIGVGAALMSGTPFKTRHCVWETVPRAVSPGQAGKRIHVCGQCTACSEGSSAYDSPHEMSIRSLAYADPRSHPHDIPWDGDPPSEWRQYDAEQKELILL